MPPAATFCHSRWTRRGRAANSGTRTDPRRSWRRACRSLDPRGIEPRGGCYPGSRPPPSGPAGSECCETTIRSGSRRRRSGATHRHGAPRRGPGDGTTTGGGCRGVHASWGPGPGARPREACANAGMPGPRCPAELRLPPTWPHHPGLRPGHRQHADHDGNQSLAGGRSRKTCARRRRSGVRHPQRVIRARHHPRTQYPECCPACTADMPAQTPATGHPGPGTTTPLSPDYDAIAPPGAPPGWSLVRGR